MSTRNRNLTITQFSILLALEALTCFTPLGNLPIGPIVATLGCLPIIAAALLMGTGAGALMGAFAGLFSVLVWTFMPSNPLIAFVFSPFYALGPFVGNGWSVAISFVPRILVGVAAGASFRLFNKIKFMQKKSIVAFGLSGVLGSLANTFFTLFGVYFAFGARYAEALGIGYEALLGIIGVTILTNGIPEAVLGALVAVGVCRPLLKYVSSAR